MEQVVKELFKPARKNYKRRRIIVKGLYDLWQADLAEFIPYSKDNRGYKYILFVIDCFSKYLWAEPIKNKTGIEITNAFENIFKRATVNPTNLQTDMGKEFYNATAQNLFKKLNINHYSTYSTKKAAIVERVIRTIKNNLYKLFSLRGKYKWIDKLQDVVNKYNNTIHSTIKIKPKDVTRKNEKHLLQTVYNNIKVAGETKFNIGDIVRVSKNKAVFEKGYTPSWSTELFKIRKVRKTNPATYLLEDMYGKEIVGGWYAEELQNTKQPDVYLVEKILRTKGNKAYVKWLGFDSSYNSWINKTNIL